MSKELLHSYEFGPFRLDPAERRLLRRDGKVVPLTAKAFETLLALVENSGHVMGKDELINRVWPETFIEEATLAQNIFIIRKALGDDQNERSYIETVPKRGYRFIAPVKAVYTEQDETTYRRDAELSFDDGKKETREADDANEPSAKPQAESLNAEKLESTRKTRRGVLIAIALLVGLAAFALSLAWRSSNTVSETAATEIRTIAVLPFSSLQGAAGSDEQLGLGIADALITNLSNLRTIVVRPTNTILKYENQKVDPQAAGRELKVDSIVEGSIQRTNARLRVTARLVNTIDGVTVWAGKFDEKYTDIFSLQDRISEQIADALKQRLTGAERERLKKRYTANTEAYRHYIQGLYHFNKRTDADLQRAVGHFEQAVKIDPAYALAYTGLARAYGVIVHYSDIPPREAYPKAKAAALKALEHDNTLAEAHAVLGIVKHGFEWDFAAAEKDYKRALELNPNYATGHHWYGDYLAHMGRFDESLATLRRAQELDPITPAISANVGIALFLARRYDEAITQCKMLIEMNPNSWVAHDVLRQVYTAAGMYEEAAQEAEQTERLAGNNRRALPALAHMNALTNRRREAIKIAEELKELSKRQYVDAVRISMIYVGLGERDEAFNWLEQAYAERSVLMPRLKTDPRWDPLRSDVRFTDMLRRVGFID